MWSSFKNSFTPAPASNEEEVPWLFSACAKGLSSIAGLLCMFFGIFNVLSLSLSCIFTGILLTLEGLIVTLIEAPCLCIFLDFANIPSKFFDGKPHWVRAVVYLIFAMMPFFICRNPTIIFGCAFMVLSSAGYLVLSLGKKASVEEMRAKAAFSENPVAVLVNNEVVNNEVSMNKLQY